MAHPSEIGLDVRCSIKGYAVEGIVSRKLLVSADNFCLRDAYPFL